MKKIPTLFKREFSESGGVNGILPQVREGLEWVLDGEGFATVKIDGACCAIIGGELYKRYDAKRGRSVPEGAIRCQDEADPITGHLPCWVKCQRGNPADQWFWVGFDALTDKIGGTYEAIGPHFQGNPYGLERERLVRHGIEIVEVERSFAGIRDYLTRHVIEGLVFWKDGEPRCKIRRRDYGLPWSYLLKGQNTVPEPLRIE